MAVKFIFTLFLDVIDSIIRPNPFRSTSAIRLGLSCRNLGEWLLFVDRSKSMAVQAVDVVGLDLSNQSLHLCTPEMRFKSFLSNEWMTCEIFSIGSGLTWLQLLRSIKFIYLNFLASVRFLKKWLLMWSLMETKVNLILSLVDQLSQLLKECHRWRWLWSSAYFLRSWIMGYLLGFLEFGPLWVFYREVYCQRHFKRWLLSQDNSMPRNWPLLAVSSFMVLW